jgi:tubulin polyglutamylase TTLL6/13
MRHNYVSCQPEEYHNRMAFHIIGLDILIDDHYEPFLLEVNHTPSFATETLLDQKIKTSLIRDTLSLLRLNDLKLKQELFHKAKICSNNRIEQGRRQSYNS